MFFFFSGLSLAFCLLSRKAIAPPRGRRKARARRVWYLLPWSPVFVSSVCLVLPSQQSTVNTPTRFPLRLAHDFQRIGASADLANGSFLASLSFWKDSRPRLFDAMEWITETTVTYPASDFIYRRTLSSFDVFFLSHLQILSDAELQSAKWAHEAAAAPRQRTLAAQKVPGNTENTAKDVWDRDISLTN